jgi:hypothetical protein
MIRAAAVTLAIVTVGMAGQRPARPAAVTVHGWVADENGRPVPALAASDIDILVDDAPVAVQAVEGRSPGLSLVVLIDKSRTVDWDEGDLARRLDRFRAQLDPADRLMLATTGGRPFSQLFQSAAVEWRREVRRAANLAYDEGYGASPIWDALHNAVTLLSAEPAPRSVLLLTDGRATGNRHGFLDVASYSLEYAVSVNVIAKSATQRISQGGNRAVLVQPAATLGRLAAYTGGQISPYPENQEEVADRVFGDLAAGLKGLHAFSFVPPRQDGAPHKLEIRVKLPRHRVHAPVAFRAPPAG